MDEQEDYINVEDIGKEQKQEKPKIKLMHKLHEDIIEGFKEFEEGIGIMQTKAQKYLYDMHPGMKKEKNKDKDKKEKNEKEHDPLGLMGWEGV